MGGDLNAISQIVDAAKDLETIKESDRALAIFPRAFRGLLCSMEIWSMQREYKVREVAKLLSHKLESLNPEKIIDAPCHIAVPALQALSYSMDSNDLKEMYASLLAKAMNSDFTESVHPGFVELIKQMSPLDAIMLKEISKAIAIPYINLVVNLKIITTSEMGTITTFHFFTEYSISCLDINSVSISVSNLIRLGLVTNPPGTFFANTSVYVPLEESTSIKNLSAQTSMLYSSISTVEFAGMENERRRLDITPYGKQFVLICLQD